MNNKKPIPYHHGNLRNALIEQASIMLHRDGITHFSLRKLSQNVGISRTGAYHHFKNKHDILCAVAAEGFISFEKKITIDDSQLNKETIHNFVHQYLNFALDNAEQYELMFGNTIWKHNKASQELKTVAFNCFKKYSESIGKFNQATGSNNLRLAQVIWAMLHGLSKLLIDGIYIDTKELDQIYTETTQSIAQLLNIDT